MKPPEFYQISKNTSRSCPATEKIILDLDGVILFDGSCGACNRLVAFTISREDGAVFRFAALQSGAGLKILQHSGLPLDYRSLVLLQNGKVYTKSGASLNIVRGLRNPWPILGILLAIPSPIRDAVYDFVAKFRLRLPFNYDRCLIRDRFADRILDENASV